MTMLLLGLLLFLAAHSVRIVADDWRTAQIARLGEGRWKAGYALVSAVGLALIVWGYGATRGAVPLWFPPLWTRHVAALLMLVSLVLLAAAYVPRNHVKAALGHPMVAGVKVWAFSHLIANGRAGDFVLFGAFLLWAVADFAAARRRDRAAGVRHPPGSAAGSAIAVAAGAGAWAALAFGLHGWLFGVAPFG